jgi:hypothetical protein
MRAFIIHLQHIILPYLVHRQITAFIMSTVWIWITCQMLHFMGVATLIGIVGLFDLRLMGFVKRISLRAAMDLMPYAIVAFIINLLTGTVFILGRPRVYVRAESLWFKFLFVILAGLNAIIFQVAFKDKALQLAPDADTPVSMKLVGAVSLFSWFAVLYFGRMVPYLGNF